MSQRVAAVHLSVLLRTSGRISFEGYKRTSARYGHFSLRVQLRNGVKQKDYRLTMCRYLPSSLGEPKHEMHSAPETFRWAVLSFAFVRKTKEPVGTLSSLRRLADLHVIFEDDETALHPFHAALDGGTKTGIPHFKAKCMTATDDIMVRRGDLAQAKKMWAGAHPLFVRSSRMKDAAAVEERLQLKDFFAWPPHSKRAGRNSSSPCSSYESLDATRTFINPPLSTTYPLLAHNDPPHDFQIPEIVEFLARARDRLDSLDHEIAAPVQGRDAIAENMRSHTAVISTIRRLPVEILCTIFSMMLVQPAHMELPQAPWSRARFSTLAQRRCRAQLPLVLVWLPYIAILRSRWNTQKKNSSIVPGRRPSMSPSTADSTCFPKRWNACGRWGTLSIQTSSHYLDDIKDRLLMLRGISVASLSLPCPIAFDFNAPSPDAYSRAIVITSITDHFPALGLWTGGHLRGTMDQSSRKAFEISLCVSTTKCLKHILSPGLEELVVGANLSDDAAGMDEDIIELLARSSYTLLRLSPFKFEATIALLHACRGCRVTCFPARKAPQFNRPLFGAARILSLRVCDQRGLGAFPTTGWVPTAAVLWDVGRCQEPVHKIPTPPRYEKMRATDPYSVKRYAEHPGLSTNQISES
ncbi:hypothetical protein DFH08DRAFT_992957 [Mycena albidolilacea]|uniref:Uncharacterized protein n=1 Tax=Mycena albidolilacea TaxID=1033008 RepID=A0AAD7EUW6_9AGAR|nr:hypothetical protein DFH08DRAFT_992957 [Mycena albidolilacea]